MQAKQITIEKQVDVLEITSSKIDDHWNLVDFMLREGLKYDGDPMSILDLKKFLKEGHMQLFMMFGSDDGEQYKVFGVCVTRITKLPNFNQCEVILLKGEKRELWQNLLANTIENLAKINSCKRIAVHARPGWQPFLKTKGWAVKRYLYTKEIK
jgi:hypothetical protein